MSVAELSDISDGHRLVFAVQIGLEREAVTVALDGYADFTMSTLTDIACAFVDRKVCNVCSINVYDQWVEEDVASRVCIH